MKNFAKFTAVALTITVLGLSACAKKAETTTTPDATTTTTTPDASTTTVDTTKTQEAPKQ